MTERKDTLFEEMVHLKELNDISQELKDPEIDKTLIKVVKIMSNPNISPEAAAGGNIGKIVDGDIIEIDIPARKINVRLTDEELAARPMTPVTRDRYVPKSLKAYASMVSSADKGAVRII